MKQTLTALVLLLVLIGLAIGGYRLIFDSEEEVTVQVESMSGAASIQGDEGAQRVASPGSVLKIGDRVKTETGGEVILSMRPEDRIVVTSDTEVRVKEVGNDRTVFELTYGQIEASVKPYSGRIVQFEAPGNAVKVETESGSFTMNHDGWGTYDLVPQEGDVRLVDGDERVRVMPGSRAVVSPDSPLVQEDALERAVLLKVQWPGAAPAGEEVQVQGKADIGSIVLVAGERIRVSGDGAFSTQVKVPDEGEVEVVARSSLGRARETSSGIQLAETPTPTKPPPPARAKAPKLQVIESGEWK